MVSIAVLGGLEFYRDLTAVSNGAVAFVDVLADYTTAIVATVVSFVGMELKLQRQDTGA